MNHSDIIFYLSNKLDSKTLSLFKLTNHYIYNISNNVYHSRTPQQHVDTLLSYESYGYLYNFKNKIFPRRFKNLSIEGFNQIKSPYTGYCNKDLKIVIFETQLRIDTKVELTIDDVNAILCKFKLPSVILKEKKFYMVKYYESLNEKKLIYKKYKNDKNCKMHRKHLSIFAQNHEVIYDICKKLL